MIEKTFTDEDGDVARFEFGGEEHPGYVSAPRGGAYLTDGDLRDLRSAIDDHLGDRPKPDPAVGATRAGIDAEIRHMLSRPLWAIPEPSPTRFSSPPWSRAEEIVYALAETVIANLKTETPA